MPHKLERLPAAKRDELDIWLHIAADSVSAADRLLDRFDATIRMLVDYPQAGQSRPELSPGLRSIAVATYTIFYRVEPHAIQIVRILSGYRDLAGQDFPKD